MNCIGVFTIPQKKSGLLYKISSSQVVTIGFGLEIFSVGLMELGGGCNGYCDH
ncbi:hypothetical protein Scep_028280 [Stephania cephalantha]|uniref:Uncharacterized protein n=1 Tax=Stephania cephalantha TaxID=152367 RepID=A0AAP0EH04_9MAGN